MEEAKFYVRCYDKVELAKMYFPKLSNPVSVAKLRRWICNCTPLMKELEAEGDFYPKPHIQPCILGLQWPNTARYQKK